MPDPKRVFKDNDLGSLAKRFGVKSWVLMHAIGCEKCANTGYKGRLAVIEYLRCDEQLRKIPKDDQFLAKAKAYNREQGGRDLLEDGLLKVLQGKTTIEEIYRVCG